MGLCWRPQGIGLDRVVWIFDWAQAQALLVMAGWSLPLPRETIDGLVWMQEGASEVLNATRSG